MWHKIEYEATETPVAKVREILPDLLPGNWYWNWQENGKMKVCFMHQRDLDKFVESLKDE